MLKRFATWLARHAGVKPDALPNGYDMGPNSWLDSDDDALTDDGRAIRDQIRKDRVWLLSDELLRLGIPVTESINQIRIRNGGDAVQRGARWEQFYREEGGLADMIALLRREAFEAAAELDPNDTDKIYYWATADRNLRRLDNKVQAIVASGRLEAARAAATGPIPIRKSA